MENPEDAVVNEQEDGGDEMLADFPEFPPRETFLDYLKSPIVELVVVNGETLTVVTAHQSVLVKSPYFEQACAIFTEKTQLRRIELTDVDVDSVGAFLEFLYLGDYFPRRIGEGKSSILETDPSIPVPDNDGSQLLRHARIYTIAEKFLTPKLKSIAHGKIHSTTSTARGEIAYARYVYSATPATDVTIRRPIAAFWATRSHVLRHEAEEEFRTMCLEFPQFGFDVLSMLLDQKEKRNSANEQGDSGGPPDTPSFKHRKRPRTSVGP